MWILFLLLVLSLSSSSTSGLVRVDRGVYSGVSVLLGEQVPHKDCPQYLDNLEVGFSLLRFQFVLNRAGEAG